MKHLMIILFVCCLSAAASFAEDYDLAAYLAQVEQNNPDMVLALKELELARTNIVHAQAAFLPNFGLQVNYNRNFTETTTSTPVASQPGGGPLIRDDVRSNFDNELTFGIGANLTLFNGGAITNYQKAKIAQAVREQNLELVRMNLLCAAKKLYAQAQLAQTVVAIMDSSEQLSRELYESTQRRINAGTAVELDLLMAEVDWTSKTIAAAEARKNAELVLIAFRNLAAIPLSEPVTLTEQFGELPAIPETPDVNAALAGRADYRALMLSGEIANLERKGAVNAFLPTISASFSWTLGGMGNGSSLMGDYAINSPKLGINISLPLFQGGGSRTARMKAADLELEKVQISLSQKRDAVERELIEIELRLTEAAQRIESAALIESSAQRAVSMSRSAYVNGAVTQLTVNEAINRLNQAGLGLQQAIFEYRCAYYDWELTTGEL